MPKIILVLTLLLPSALFSQKYFDKTKQEVKKELENYVTANKAFNPTLTETDTTLVLSITGQEKKTDSFVYGFDKTSGKCSYQRTMAGCDSCYKKYLNDLLNQKEYAWKKINGNQYVSKFASHLMLELPFDKDDFTFTLFRASWTKELYDILIKN
ncbi:MAG: hypothetical protein U0U70_04545 [Chitinophagaceae bacterium]